MAKLNKKSLRPAAWWTNLPSAESRQRQALYLNSTVKLLRDYFAGFDAVDGYDLRHPERWSAQRLNVVKRYGAAVHSMTATPHYRAVARSEEQRRVLKKYTGQAFGGSKKQRAFVVHHPEAAYRDIKIKVNKQGRVTLTKKSANLTTRSQIFMFIDYGFNPRRFASIDDVIRATRAMIDSGDMPEEGHYQLESAQHGPIWYTLDRDDILLNLNTTVRDSGARSPTFASGLLGWRYYVDEVAAELLNEAKAERLSKLKKIREKYKHSNAMQSHMAKWQKEFYDDVIKKGRVKGNRAGLSQSDMDRVNTALAKLRGKSPKKKSAKKKARKAK